MEQRATRAPKARTGFTLLELMIAVGIVGALAAIAIPAYHSYQLRTKTAEAKTNLSAIRTLENSYFSEYEAFVRADPEPAVIPGAVSVVFNSAGSDFAALGFSPEGRVYFSYGVNVSADGVGFSADAGGDIDTNGIAQFWGFTKPDANGVRPAGEVGCPVAGLTIDVVGPCTPSAGQTVF